MDVPRRNPWVAAAGLGFPLLATVLAGVMANSFAPLHRFLQPLPLVSQIFLDTWAAAALLALPLLALWWLQRDGVAGERRLLAASVTVGVGVFAFALVACYAPIFRLAASA